MAISVRPLPPPPPRFHCHHITMAILVRPPPPPPPGFIVVSLPWPFRWDPPPPWVSLSSHYHGHFGEIVLLLLSHLVWDNDLSLQVTAVKTGRHPSPPIGWRTQRFKVVFVGRSINWCVDWVAVTERRYSTLNRGTCTHVNNGLVIIIIIIFIIYYYYY